MVKKFLCLLAFLWTIPAQASIVQRGKAVGSAGSPATTASVVLPSNIQANDLIYLGCFTDNSQNPNTPTGFTLITGGNQSNSTERFYHFTKTAVGADAGATVNCTTSAGADIVIRVRVFYSTDGAAPQVGATNFSTATGVSSVTFASTNAPTKSGSAILLVARENQNITVGFDAGVIDPVFGGFLIGGTATGFFGVSGTTFPSPMASISNGASGNWMAAAIELQTSNGSSAGAVLVSGGAFISGAGNCSALTPSSETQNGDVEFTIMDIGSATPAITPPAGWTLGPQITNANANPNAASLTIYTHTKAGGDAASWNFTNATTNGNICVIVSVGNLNTTTPIDVSQTLSVNQANKNMPIPALNPTASDELLLRVGALPGAGTFTSAPAGVTRITGLNQGQADLEVVYDDPTLNASLYLGNNVPVADGALGMSLGLQSSATPTRTTANQRVEQLGLITLAPFGAPEPPPSCGNCGLGVGAP